MEKRKRAPGGGRKRQYAEGNGTGAPTLRVRLDPDVHAKVTAQPEGAREYLQRLVRADDR